MQNVNPVRCNQFIVISVCCPEFYQYSQNAMQFFSCWITTSSSSFNSLSFSGVKTAHVFRISITIYLSTLVLDFNLILNFLALALFGIRITNTKVLHTKFSSITAYSMLFSFVGFLYVCLSLEKKFNTRI